MPAKKSFFYNAASNVIRGGASSLVAIALPYFFSRALDTNRFAAWALVLQMAAYANFLDFGLQTAIARFIAQAAELRQDDRLDELVSTSIALLCGAAAVAFLVITGVIFLFPHFFQHIPAQIYPEFRGAALLLSASAVSVIALSSFPSTLLGLHRNDLVAMAIGLSRLGGALAAVLALRYTHSLILLAACIGAANLLAALVQIAMVRRLIPGLRLRVTNIRRLVAVELAQYCAGLTVWNVGLLIVSGLDLLLVGHFRFEAVGVYSIALSAATLFAGVNSYIVTALLAPLSVLHARQEMSAIGRIVVSVTALDVVVNGAVAASTFIIALPVLRLWVAPYATAVLPLMQILMVAQAIRLSGLTFSVTLVALGQQNKGMAQGWVEALVNLVASVIGVVWFGPIGVAWGTLLGACCSLGWISLVTMRRVEDLPLTSREFMREALLRPLLCLSPMLVLALLASRLSQPVAFAAELAGLVLTAALVKSFLPLCGLHTSGISPA